MTRRLTDERRGESQRPGSATAPTGTTVRQVATDAVRRIGSRRMGVEQARHFFQAATTFVERAEPAAIEAIATSLDRAAAGVAYSAHDIETVRAATGRPPLLAEDVAVLEAAAILDAFRWRREALAGALTAPQVAELLGASRQTPHDRVKRGALLAIMDRGAQRFPAWQFDATAPGGVVPGLPEVLKALRVAPLVKLSWLTHSSRDLGGETPLAALRRGEVDRVVAIARVLGLS